jgi:hypothetical protein
MGTTPHSPGTTLSQNFLDLNGQPITEFVIRLSHVQREFASIRFVTYRPEPKLTQRLGNLLTPEEQALRESATSICHDSGIPYWDALLGLCMKRPEGIPERFVEAAGAHGSNEASKQFDLSPSEISSERIATIIDDLPDGCGLVISSKARLKSGEFAHIPMLDFRCPCSEGNATAIAKIVGLLGQKGGVLAESGQSYHYYGIELFSVSQWTNFMARALLFAPIVDPRYIGHRIADGECRLKITSARNAAIPKIVGVYG